MHGAAALPSSQLRSPCSDGLWLLAGASWYQDAGRNLKNSGRVLQVVDTPGLHFPGYRELVEGNGDRYEMPYLLSLGD